MADRGRLIGLIGIFSLLLAVSAPAQPPRWGRDRTVSPGACFYEDVDFRGEYLCVRQGDRLPSLPEGMGDRISSIRMTGNSEVTVFRDTDMRGRSTRFIDDVRDFKGRGWNDQISSLEVSTARPANRNAGGWRKDRPPVWGRNQRTPREGACFYQDANFRGQSFCVPRGAAYTALPRDINDRIASVRVFGAEVRIFQDRDFRGRSVEIRSDTRNLRGDWKDSISSIRIF